MLKTDAACLRDSGRGERIRLERREQTFDFCPLRDYDCLAFAYAKFQRIPLEVVFGSF